MKHIYKLAQGIDVAEAHSEILSVGDKWWNAHPERTSSKESPHREIDDIWLRYQSRQELLVGSSQMEPHESVFYPAWEDFPAIQSIVFDVMRFSRATRLGGILLTKIPAGKMCYPHTDNGWHAKYYEKFAVQIRASHGQAFCFDDGRFESITGDLYTFDNHVGHWVENPTDEDRITLIICIRRS